MCGIKFSLVLNNNMTHQNCPPGPGLRPLPKPPCCNEQNQRSKIAQLDTDIFNY